MTGQIVCYLGSRADIYVIPDLNRSDDDRARTYCHPIPKTRRTIILSLANGDAWQDREILRCDHVWTQYDGTKVHNTQPGSDVRSRLQFNAAVPSH